MTHERIEDVKESFKALGALVNRIPTELSEKIDMQVGLVKKATDSLVEELGKTKAALKKLEKDMAMIKAKKPGWFKR